MTSTQLQAMENGLLASLDPEHLMPLLAKMSKVTFENRQPVYTENEPIDFVYFPLSGMISMVINLADGTQAEVGLIGREGMGGATLISGATTSFVNAMIQMPGSALRMTARDFRQAFEKNAQFRGALLRFNEALQAQVMQTAACNGRHQLEKRLARWLLMAHDRQEGDVLRLTQEFIAMMLGVHRPSITVAAGVLSRAGSIRYGAGRITVVNREKLEAASCECYRTVRCRVHALLPSAGCVGSSAAGSLNGRARVSSRPPEPLRTIGAA